jgi:glycosyltransferase involved in cell wall biosynthesis
VPTDSAEVKAMLKIAHLDHTQERGGAELALARLIQCDPGWIPQLFLPPSPSSENAFSDVPPQFVTRVGVPQPPGAIGGRGLSQINLLLRVIVQALTVRRRRDFRDTQIVHANTSRSALIGWLATTGSSRSLVIHLRDAVEAEAIGRINARALQTVLRNADGVIANSTYTLGTASKFLKPGALARVIPSPVGLETDIVDQKSESGVKIIGMLARIAKWKGHELLIRAFAEACRGRPIKLQLAGAPAFGAEAFLNSLVELVDELQIQGQVEFIGHITDIWPTLRSWDVCVHASLQSEPLGQNVLQYLAACRPTIAVNSGGPAEWIEHGHTGLLFEMGNQKELTEALRLLMENDRLRLELSENLASERPVPTDSAVRNMCREFFELLPGGGATPQRTSV